MKRHVSKVYETYRMPDGEMVTVKVTKGGYIKGNVELPAHQLEEIKRQRFVRRQKAAERIHQVKRRTVRRVSDGDSQGMGKFWRNRYGNFTNHQQYINKEGI